MDRQPCPHRIFDDLAIGFTMGTCCGGLFHFVRGAKNAPRGEIWRSAFTSMQTRGPVIGGNFAVWGGLFSTFECALLAIRKKDDIYNSITSGFITGGVLAIRGGWKAAMRSAIFGGIFLGMIEGVSLLMYRFAAKQQAAMAVPPPPPAGSPPRFGQKHRDREFDFVPPYLS
jgi:import inner membrane translocase subunit TIM17